MVNPVISAFVPACNRPEGPAALTHDHRYRNSDTSTGVAHAPGTRPHPGLVEHPFVSPEEQVTILAAVDEAVVAELGDLIAALPHHPRPITAVLALIEAGLLAVDFQAPFDSSVRIWRP
jgi:hypothetical protein